MHKRIHTEQSISSNPTFSVNQINRSMQELQYLLKRAKQMMKPKNHENKQRNTHTHQSKSKSRKYHSPTTYIKVYEDSQEQIDIKNKTQRLPRRFIPSQSFYLNLTQRISPAKSGSSQKSLNKTFKIDRKYSTSPKQKVSINKLHLTKINNQPCLRYERTREKQKISVKKLVSQYCFIKKYLSERQIWDIMRGLEKEGISEKQWGVKIIDIIYRKLRYLQKS